MKTNKHTAKCNNKRTDRLVYIHNRDTCITTDRHNNRHSTVADMIEITDMTYKTDM